MSTILTKIKYLYQYLTDSKFRFLYDVDKGRYNNWDDEKFIRRMYYCKMGKELNLEDPKSFTEKLQWLKLNDRNLEYSKMVDKIEAKKIIASKAGEQYVVPTLGQWDAFEDINFDELPDQFILKCTHDSGSYYICKDKKHIDYKMVEKKFRNAINREYYLTRREWPYKDVKPRIIAEPLLKNKDDEGLIDYKFFCFDGKAKMMYIANDVSKHPTTDFFDMEYSHLPIKMRDANAKIPPKKPEQFDEMRSIAEKLSSGIPHLRVDFYIVNEKVYVGEMTFFHMGGFVKIKPEGWDEKIGSWLELRNR